MGFVRALLEPWNDLGRWGALKAPPKNPFLKKKEKKNPQLRNQRTNTLLSGWFVRTVQWIKPGRWG